MRFTDRAEAGRVLAERCRHLAGPETVVLGLPRGGVPVARVVSEALNAPLDVIVVRKVGVPWQPELAMGAVGEDGVEVRNRELIDQVNVSDPEFARVAAEEREVVHSRARRLRGQRARVPLTGRTAVVVDDGIATGATARAACQVAREHGARRVVLAVPVAPAHWEKNLGDAADEYICVQSPELFTAVGQWYQDFSPVTDDDVATCLSPPTPMACDEVLSIPMGSITLTGDLVVPHQAKGLVVFAHGSGSSRLSPRNRAVAVTLNRSGLGTLLFDLLTDAEADERTNVFDVALLGGRLVEVTRWLRRVKGFADVPVGYFGASTGAAAALWAAAELPDDVRAVVSRGGRPDLAGGRLTKVRAPTLLIVGSRDPVVLDLNRAAHQELQCRSSLVVVEGATHLFQEIGALDKVAWSAIDWFTTEFAR